MRYKKLITVILILLVASCGKKHPTEPDQPNIPSTPITGSVSLPTNCPLIKSDFQILTAAKAAKVSEQGQFQSSVIEAKKTQIVGVTNKSENLILLGCHNPGQIQLEISAKSTAKALVLMMPMFFLTSLEQRLEILSQLEIRDDFLTLVSYIENVLVNDPENSLNYAAHPLIYQQAATVAVSLLKDYAGGLSLAKRVTPLENPWIEDGPGSKIVFQNPKCVYYASSIKRSDDNKQIELLVIDAKSSLWSYQFAWPPVYWTPPVATSTENELGDGNFNIYLTKGFDFENLSSFFEWNSPDGRASLYNIGKGILFVVDVIIGDVPTAPITRLRLSATETAYYLMKMGKAAGEGDLLEFFENFITLMAENVDQICYWIWQEASTDVQRAYASQLFKVLGNVAAAIKVITMAESAANEIIPFFYDIIKDERTLTFFVSQSNGHITTNTQNSNPYTPDAPQGNQYATVNETVYFTVQTYDPDYNNIAYRFYWGDGNISPWSNFVPSGTEITMGHVYNAPGVYQVSAEAKDVFGATSALSPTSKLLINPQGSFFYYTFDNDLPGSAPSSPPWTIDQEMPSYLAVTNSSYWGALGNSCAFYDYDPDLGTETGEYAQIWAELQSNPKGTVEFVWKIEAADDDFGLRAWESWDWSYMAYYVLFYDGQLSYYDGSNFIPIYTTYPGTWYQMKISYDLFSLSYNVYINGNLVKSNIPFVGNPRSINYLQVVAFSDASCRTGYVDQIQLSQRTTFTLSKGTAKIPEVALKIKQ